jgi:hypothetical protein
MVACFLRHAQWDVAVQKDAEADDVHDLVAGDWFAVLGFTLSAEAGLESLCRAIQGGRGASANPDIGILVGGPLFRAKPDLVAQVGADAMAGDAASASLLAKKLLLRQESKATRDGHDATRVALAGSQSFIQSSNVRNVAAAAAITARASRGSQIASSRASTSFQEPGAVPLLEKNR